ncbi:MAG: CopD family protein [Comamonadaceae bacterium]|nr:CopD family protein [Comamonadaceae bacterium]
MPLSASREKGVPWLKLLHLAAVIVWCGALPYLAVALATAGEPPRKALPRALFTTVATPAALVAIASGTAIFVFHGPTAEWLIAKLVLVALLVLGHAMAGVLVLRVERDGGAVPVGGAADPRLDAAVAGGDRLDRAGQAVPMTRPLPVPPRLLAGVDADGLLVDQAPAEVGGQRAR